MTIMKNKFKRSKVYVSRAIQGRLIKRLVAMWILYHLFLWNCLFLSEGVIGKRPQPVGELYTAFFAEHVFLFTCAVAILPIVIWDMVKTTHRFAGPLVRFEHALKAMARGERLDQIKLRKGDMTLEFLDVFNDYVQYHNRMVATMSNNGLDIASGSPVTQESAQIKSDVSRTHERTVAAAGVDVE